MKGGPHSTAKTPETLGLKSQKRQVEDDANNYSPLRS